MQLLHVRLFALSESGFHGYSWLADQKMSSNAVQREGPKRVVQESLINGRDPSECAFGME
jgi:hypothetical protein